MQLPIKGTAKTQGNAHAEPVMMQKRIGSTVYTVTVHFSEKNSEAVEDKILRLIKREVSESA